MYSIVKWVIGYKRNKNSPLEMIFSLDISWDTEIGKILNEIFKIVFLEAK